MIEIVVDGLPVPVDEDGYLSDPEAVVAGVREHRAQLRLNADDLAGLED